jgi:hypothetical protein
MLVENLDNLFGGADEWLVDDRKVPNPDTGVTTYQAVSLDGSKSSAASALAAGIALSALWSDRAGRLPQDLDPRSAQRRRSFEQ